MRLLAKSPTFLRRAYAVLAPVSRRYPPLRGTFRCITHPFAARRQSCPRAAARLACVKHAASVQSEPGSNSSVQSIQSLSIDVGPIPILKLPPKNQDKTFHRVSTSSFLHPSKIAHATPPGHQATPAPTLIGCFLLKIRPA